ncbi:MAG: hypothetical protein ACE5IL_05565 [Myxococcota bacterium]
MSVVAACLLGGAIPIAAHASVDHADPIPVPRGRVPAPDPHLEPETRLLQAERQLRDRGFSDLPTLAAAALELGDDVRALELAPHDPWVRWQVALRQHAPVELVRACLRMARSFPAWLWLATWMGASLALGFALATAVLVGLGLARTLGLHGHALGHVTWQRDPPAWPGVLLLASTLGLVAAAGLGPLPWLALAALLAMARLPRAEALTLAAMILVCTVLLGPPLDRWAQVATLPVRHPEVLAAWRIEREQPLPGDQALLASALGRAPSDDRLRVVTALGWLRLGDLERVRQVLAPLAAREEDLPPVLRARAATLRGSVLLARGEVALATPDFEAAARLDPSAASLYNLSQVQGRALRLIEQGTTFAAARVRDPELLSRYTQQPGSTLHRYLIESPLPLSSYLAWTLSPGPASRALAGDVRRRLLGSALPESRWPASALVLLLAPFLRRRGMRRCLRCLRPICARCDASVGGPGRTCPRCLSLFSPSATQDARLRRRQLERDQARQRVKTCLLALLALGVPGSARVVEGRALPGLARVLAAGAAAAAIALARSWGEPSEIGGLVTVLPVLLGSSVLVPLYIEAAVEARHRLLERRRQA